MHLQQLPLTPPSKLNERLCKWICFSLIMLAALSTTDGSCYQQTDCQSCTKETGYFGLPCVWCPLSDTCHTYGSCKRILYYSIFQHIYLQHISYYSIFYIPAYNILQHTSYYSMYCVTTYIILQRMYYRLQHNIAYIILQHISYCSIYHITKYIILQHVLYCSIYYITESFIL